MKHITVELRKNPYALDNYSALAIIRLALPHVKADLSSEESRKAQNLDARLERLRPSSALDYSVGATILVRDAEKIARDVSASKEQLIVKYHEIIDFCTECIDEREQDNATVRLYRAYAYLRLAEATSPDTELIQSTAISKDEQQANQNEYVRASEQTSLYERYGQDDINVAITLSPNSPGPRIRAGLIFDQLLEAKLNKKSH